jgi:hypothetical protein
LELICIEGAVPGKIVATLCHEARIRQIPMAIAQHPAGGWHVALPEGEFGPRCHGVVAAILLEASEAFTPERVDA